MQLAKNFSANMRSARKARGWYVKELAGRAGFSESYIRQLESRATNPTLNVVECVAIALDVPVPDLLKEPAS